MQGWLRPTFPYFLFRSTGEKVTHRHLKVYLPVGGKKATILAPPATAAVPITQEMRGNVRCRLTPSPDSLDAGSRS